MINSVTVYCSSSKSLAPIYYDAGRDLGRAIAAQGWTLIYGGNNVGLMGVLAEAVRAGGGKVVGITPKLFCDKGLDDKRCDELVVTDGMRDRKAILEERGDAFIAMPGGLGTFEEIFEIIVGKQLGFHNKPIELLDTNGYWSPLVELIDRAIEQKFIKPKARELFHVTPGVADAITHIQAYKPRRASHDWFPHDNEIPSAAE
jgi:cytokinin riboside 5'-monophosphate phosphoribohydrolase